MSRPTIIMAAPNGARKVKTDHPQLPVSIDETIAAAKACHAEGASILHAHVRGDQDEHVLDIGRYKTLLAGLRSAVPDMLVQITTEAVGVYTPQQQYDVVFGVKPDFVSVGLREILADDSAAAHQLAKDFYHRAHRNRATAMNMLKARLYELELQKREEAANDAASAKTDIGWGNQIRSYVLHPYQMVKDLRTNVEKGNANGVLDGDLDEFVEASLAARVGAQRNA